MRYVIVTVLIVVLIAVSGKGAAQNAYVSYVRPALTEDTPAIGLAAYAGDISTLRRCIAAGLSVESAGKQRRTPLLLASAGGQIEAVKILLRAGANVNAQDRGRETALHWAAARGETEIALLLLQHHATVNAQGEFGETPLILAAIAGDKTIVVALLKAGADPKVEDVEGWTASSAAKRNNYNDIAALLR